MSKKSKEDDIIVEKREDKMSLHYHPKVTLEKFEEILEHNKGLENPNPTIVNLFDDAVKIIAWAVTKLAPEAPKEEK